LSADVAAAYGDRLAGLDIDPLLVLPEGRAADTLSCFVEQEEGGGT
jgi:hypothetical protein